MTETIQTAMDRLMTISVEPQDYVAEDGLLYCGICKTPKEAFFPNGKKLFGRDRHPAECRCRQATREKQEKEERARLHYEKVQRLKLQGFTDWAMQHWTFASDHGQNSQMQLAQRYVAHWPEMREKNVGLLLWGGVGTGKSFMAGCINIGKRDIAIFPKGVNHFLGLVISKCRKISVSAFRTIHNPAIHRIITLLSVKG